MKRRKVAMLMAVLMTASSLSGSYVSAASIEGMEVTAETAAEETATQSQETESETVQTATEETELSTQEAVVPEEESAAAENTAGEVSAPESAPTESENAAPESEISESESAASESENSESESAAPESETSMTETPAPETESGTEALTETETPPSEEAAEAHEGENDATEPEISVASMEAPEEEVREDYYIQSFSEDDRLRDEERNDINPLVDDPVNFSTQGGIYLQRVKSYASGDSVEESVEDLDAEGIRWRAEYDKNEWARVDESADGTGLPELRRKSSDEIGVTILAERYVEESSSWEEIARKEFIFGQLEYSLDFNYSYGGRDNSILFYGDRSEELVLELNTEGLNGLDGYEVQWTVTQDGNEANEITCAGISKDGASITLTPAEGFQEEGHWLDVEAKILKYGNEITATGTYLDVIPTELDIPRYYSEDQVLLPGQSHTLTKEFEVWVRNPKDPWGESVPVHITSVKINDPEELFWYNGNEDGTVAPDEFEEYRFTAKSEEDLKAGSADVFLSFAGTADENQDIVVEQQFSLSVNTERYSVEWAFSTDTGSMICGSEQDIVTSVYREWCNPDGSFDEGDVTDYTVEVGADYDTELVEVTTDEDQKTLHVKAKAKEGETNISVCYKVGDQKIAERTVGVSVSRSGHQLEPEVLLDENGEAINPLKEDILDLTAFEEEFKVYYLQYNEETGEIEKTEEPKESIRYRVNYDEDVWTRMDDSEEEYGLPVLKRVEGWETSINITAEKNLADPNSEEENWSWVAGKSYTFASVNYYLDFEYSYGDGYLFYGDRSEPLTMTLLSEESLDRLKDYEIVWEVLQDGMDADEAADLTCATITAEGNTLTLTPAEGFSEEGHYLYVGAKLMKGEKVIAQEYRQLDLIRTENNLEDQLSDQVLFPGWNYTIEPEYEIWVKNPKHPYGTELPVRITSVNISDPDQVFNCDKDENGAIVAEENGSYMLWVANDENDLRFGEAKLTVAYEYAGEEEEDLQGEVTVSLVVAGEDYHVDYEYVQYNGWMVYGSEMDIRTSVVRQWYDQDEGYTKGEDFTAYTVELAEDKTFDSELVTVSVDEDQQTLHVKAKAKEGGTNIPIYYKAGDKKVGESNIRVYVSPGNYYLESDYSGNSAVNPLIGETIDLASWNFRLYQLRYNEESEEVEKIEIPEEDIDYYWVSYDENMWNRLESSEGSRGLAKLQRKRSYGGSITVYAGYGGSDIGKSYNFDGFDYQAELEYSYGGPENSRVYTNAPLTLTVKTEPEIENQEGISIDWDVFVYDENGNRQPPECMGWTVAEDGRFIEVTGREYCEGQWFQVEAIVKAYDEEITRCEYGIEVRGESYYFTGMENMRAYMFIGQKKGPFFTRDTNGRIWMETYQESGEYPEGKRTKVEVTGIEEDCEEGNELLRITDNEEGIHILPLGKTGQTFMRFLLADEEGNEVPSISCEVYVQEDYINIINIEVKRESGEGTCLLPGETLKLQPVLARLFTDENGEIQQGPLEASDYHIVYTNYDENIIQVDEDGTVHTVGRGNSWVTVQVLDAEGQEITSNGLDITVTGKYYQLRTGKETAPVLAPGESLNEQFTPYVYSINRPEGEESGDGTFVIREILNDTEGVHVSISETGLLSVSLDKDTTLRKGSIQSMEILVGYQDADGNYLTDTNYVVVLCNHDGKVIERKAATCTEDGYVTYECKQCASTWKETLPATGHTEVVDAGVKATCETAGKTEGSHCAACGKVLKAQTIIPATGHTAVTDAGVKAACETAGKTEGSHCAACGKVLKVQTTIPATGHTAVTDAGVKATCETVGKTEGSNCSTCGKVLKAQTTIAATGHTWSKWTTTSEATVFAPAEQQRTCSVCKETEERTTGKALTKVLKLNASSISLQTRQKTTEVKVTAMAKGDSVKSWKSSNTKIVSVKGKKNGTCTITAGTKTGTARITVKLASGKTGKITVKVQKTVVKTTGITSSVKKCSLVTGETKKLDLTVKPITSEEKLVFTSSNLQVAAVTRDGMIVAKTPGTARITAKSGKKSVTITVTVKKAVPTAITGIPAAKTLKKGKSFTLKPVLEPAGVTAKLTYTTSNRKVAVVTSKGKVTAKGKGSAVITVKTGKLIKKCRVTVK